MVYVYNFLVTKTQNVEWLRYNTIPINLEQRVPTLPE